MLTTLALACMLGMPQSTCTGPGCSGTGGGFPLPMDGCGQGGACMGGHHLGSHPWFCHKEPCPLGSFVPCGDDWAVRMHGASPVSAGPITLPSGPAAPAAAPAPAPAP